MAKKKKPKNESHKVLDVIYKHSYKKIKDCA